MKWRGVGIVGLMLGLLLAFYTACASPAAEVGSPVESVNPNAEEPRTVSVSGSGTVSAPPDEVVLRLGVETMADTARQAVSENSQQMAAVIDALREAGIPDENIQTQRVRLNAQYDTMRETERPPRRELVGYAASNIVEARTADLDGVGRLLDEAVEAGANRIEGLRFQLSDPGELLERAREAAWHDAEQKADQLASLAGLELREVLTIDETTRAPRPVPGVAPALEAEMAVPVEPGAEDVTVDLQVTWSLH